MPVKSIRVHGLPPKQFSAKVQATIDAPAWDENETAKWIKATFSDTVWFDVIAIHDRWGKYMGHMQTLWFKSKRDAMIYRLTVKDKQ